MSRSLDIRNLSITLDALSHVQGAEATCNTVRRMIEAELEFMQEDMNEEMKRRYTPPRVQQNIPDDDIPF